MKRKKLKTVLSLFITVLFTQINYAQTVTIGNQVWMTKNLNVDKFRNDDPIPQAKTDAEWKAAEENKQPAWCYYDNDPSYGAKCGKLYNFYAVIDSRGLTPEGYDIPTAEEWTTLENYLGNDAGNKMKSTIAWFSYITGGSKSCPNCKYWNAEYRKKVPCHTCKDTRSVKAPTKTNRGNGTNSNGFSALPCGRRQSYDGAFELLGEYGEFWSSTEYDDYNAKKIFLMYFSADVESYHESKGYGLSVRCLMD